MPHPCYPTFSTPTMERRLIKRTRTSETCLKRIPPTIIRRTVFECHIGDYRSYWHRTALEYYRSRFVHEIILRGFRNRFVEPIFEYSFRFCFPSNRERTMVCKALWGATAYRRNAIDPSDEASHYSSVFGVHVSFFCTRTISTALYAITRFKIDFVSVSY